MAFREKTAWIMAFALLLGGAFYGYVVWAGSQAMGGMMPPLIPIIAIYVALLVVIAIIGHIGAALTSLSTANDPMDERELAIVTRSVVLSDSVMGVGILISLGLYLLNYNGHQLFHLVFGTLMISQFLHYAVQIILFRQHAAPAQ